MDSSSRLVLRPWHVFMLLICALLLSLQLWLAEKPTLEAEKEAGNQAQVIGKEAQKPAVAGSGAALPKQVQISTVDELLNTGLLNLKESHGVIRHYRLALDELQDLRPEFRGRKNIQRQESARALVAQAQLEASRTGRWPGLVMYPQKGPANQGSRRVLTGRMLVELRNEAVATPELRAAGLRVLERPSYSLRHVVAESLTGSPLQALESMDKLRGHALVAGVSPLLGRHARPAAVPNDPYFAKQWYLENTGQGKGTKGFDIQIKDVWNQALGTGQGQGVRIAIVDDGLDILHSDLLANVDSQPTHFNWLAAPDSLQRFDPSPDPKQQNYHGTSVAGVAAARGNNGIGVTGVAPLANLVGHRFLDETTELDDAVLANIISYQNDIIQIKNNSWGMTANYYATTTDTGVLVEDALKDSGRNGRNRRGVISVWAAGNAREYFAQGNKNGLANSIYSVAVGAMTNQGKLASYSETGSHLCVVAPSDGGTLKIATTDVSGVSGYNPHPTIPDIEEEPYDYTGTFGGTSSAAPVVSGVIALMLEARPDLTFRDVKEILLRSSLQVDPKSTTWVKTTARDTSGLPPVKHSTLYGGGLVQAKAAVEMAKNWTLLGRPLSMYTSLAKSVSINFAGNPNKVSPTEGTASGQATSYTYPEPEKPKPLRLTCDLSEGLSMRVEHVTLKLNLAHAYQGDLTINLTSPAGVVSNLATATAYDAGEGYVNFTFSSLRHWGEPGQGLWYLDITDTQKPNDGTLTEAILTVYGSPMPGPSISSVVNPRQIVPEGSPITLSVQATGPADMTRSWLKDGKTIPKQTAATLPNIGLKITDAGTYKQVCSSSWARYSSDPFLVTVLRRNIPASSVKEGETAILQAVAAGPQISYQWLRGTSLTPLVDNGRITGTNTPKLTIRDVRATDEQTYVCRVFMPNVPVVQPPAPAPPLPPLPPLSLDTLPTNLWIQRRPVIQPTVFLTPGMVGAGTPQQLSANNAVTRWTVTGLPPGMSLNAATGAITGIPTTAGRFRLTITATNAAGTSLPVVLDWDVLPLHTAVVGTYHGLVSRHPFYNGGFGGALTLTTTRTGSYSGSITRGIHNHRFTGQLQVSTAQSVPVSGNVSLARRAPFGPLTFFFEMPTTSDSLSGYLTDPALIPPDLAGVSGLRAALSTELASPLPGSRWNTTYELPVPLVGSSSYPQGATWGTQTLSTSGIATWSGRLADGTVVVLSTGISQSGQTPLHAMLYSGAGSVQGWQTLDRLSGLSAGSLNWVKAPVTSRSYATGFPLHDLTGTGGRHVPPTPGSLVYGISSGIGNARFIFTQGGLATPFSQSFTLGAGNIILMPGGTANPYQILATLDLSTGIITGSGSALDIDPQNPALNRQRPGTFSALLNPAAEKAIGHFLLPTSLSPSAPILSGKVVGEESLD